MAKPATKIVRPGQSIWDFAIEHWGDPGGIAELISLNRDKINFFDDLVAGTELVIGTPINQAMVDFFAAEVQKPSTAIHIDADVIDGAIELEDNNFILLETGDYILTE